MQIKQPALSILVRLNTMVAHFILFEHRTKPAIKDLKGGLGGGVDLPITWKPGIFEYMSPQYIEALC